MLVFENVCGAFRVSSTSFYYGSCAAFGRLGWSRSASQAPRAYPKGTLTRMSPLSSTLLILFLVPQTVLALRGSDGVGLVPWISHIWSRGGCHGAASELLGSCREWCPAPANCIDL